MTRRALWLPLLATVATAACAPLKGTMPALGPVGWREASAAYGADERQGLRLYRPERAEGLPMVVLLAHGVPGQAEHDRAKALADQGMVVILADRRPSPVSVFPAYISDAARAVAWAAHHAEALGGSPDHLGILGQGEGALAGLMLAHDGRYLASVDPAIRLKIVVALDAPAAPDTSLTHPSVYVGTGGKPLIWQGSRAEWVVGQTQLKQGLT